MSIGSFRYINIEDIYIFVHQLKTYFSWKPFQQFQVSFYLDSFTLLISHGQTKISCIASNKHIEFMIAQTDGVTSNGFCIMR